LVLPGGPAAGLGSGTEGVIAAAERGAPGEPGELRDHPGSELRTFNTRPALLTLQAKLP
jgi:hypothetical protein